MSNPERDLVDYLRESLIVSRHQLANHKQLMRRALAIIGGIGLAFLISGSVCMWSICGIYKHNSEVIEQTMILQSLEMAMFMTRPQNANAHIEISPDGKVAVKDTK